MAASNVEIVQAVIDAQNRGDPKSVYKLYDAAIEWHDRGGWEAGTTNRGWTIRDGLIVKVRVYNDLALALRELADELDS